MQISYCFIEDFININNQEINFGSPFIFQKVIKDERYHLTMIPNESYVDALFRRNSENRFDNISALVGENGSGKTNILNFLTGALSNESRFSNGFIVFVDRNNSIKVLNHTDRGISADFEFQMVEHRNNYAGIYYNPIYDFQDHPGEYNPQIIDVSSNSLFHDDFYDDQFFSETLDAVELHKFKNISRQVRFIVSQKNSRIITRYINIPRQIEVAFIDPKFSHDGKGIDNVSIDFRPFFLLGMDIWREEKNKVSGDLYQHRQSGVKRGINEFYKEIGFVDFLQHLWKFIFYTQEKNSDTLYEGHVPNYSQKDFDELKKLSFEDFFKVFLLNQNVFPATSIIKFIDTIKPMFESSRLLNRDPSGYVSFFCNLNQAERIIEGYDPMVEDLSKLLHGKKPNGLLQFKWRSISSGERALLDLFARINYAKELIEYNLKSDPSFIAPEYFYLFFDEGEMGFHLQWQKEYVKTMLDILPRILRYNTNLKKDPPKIQLIFSTHSPITLSDIPRYNTVYLSKDESFNLKVHTEKESPKYSFGANVNEIMYDAFYLKDGFIGNFSKQVIDELFEWTNNEKSKRLSASYARKVIDLIDDPILRIKLEEVFAERFNFNVEEQVLRAKIQLMEKRITDIQKGKRNDPDSQ